MRLSSLTTRISLFFTNDIMNYWAGITNLLAHYSKEKRPHENVSENAVKSPCYPSKQCFKKEKKFKKNQHMEKHAAHAVKSPCYPCKQCFKKEKKFKKNQHMEIWKENLPFTSRTKIFQSSRCHIHSLFLLSALKKIMGSGLYSLKQFLLAFLIIFSTIIKK